LIHHTPLSLLVLKNKKYLSLFFHSFFWCLSFLFGINKKNDEINTQEIATLSLGSKPIVYPPSSYNAGPPSSSYNAVPPPGSSPPYEPSPGFTPVASPGFSPVGYTPSPAYNPYNPASSPSAFPASSPYPTSSPSYESGYSSSYGDNNASSVYPTATVATTSHSEDPAPSTYSSSYL